MICREPYHTTFLDKGLFPLHFFVEILEHQPPVSQQGLLRFYVNWGYQKKVFHKLTLLFQYGCSSDSVVLQKY